MAPKPGIKTTEFWIAILTAIGAISASASGVLPERLAGILATISGAVYALSRGLAKISPPNTVGTPLTMQTYPIEPPYDGTTTEPPPTK